MLFDKLVKAAFVACTLLSDDLLASGSTFGDKVRMRENRGRDIPSPAAKESEGARDTANYRYYNGNTKKFFVESLPEVDYDLGEMYSGLIPIDTKDPSRQLFFVWQPTIGKPVDEVVIWLNGGPGCSSLDGFFQENGRFLWQPGVFAPTTNPYSWVNLTNMLWVEQPVGTGFSIGKVTAKNEVDIANDFVKWFKNFQTTFGIKNYKIYVTGESYAGRYVPYISAGMLDQKNKEYYDLSGAITFDPCIGQFDYTQENVVIVPMINSNAQLWNFNKTYMANLNERHQSCGYQEVIDKYYQFPPPGNQPAVQNPSGTCDIFDEVFIEAFNPNPCFDIYEINSACPIPSDPLGFPTALEYNGPGVNQVYFDRMDVKKAMHAPLYVDWQICAANPVFVSESGGPEDEGDYSPDPIQAVLPQVIEATNRVLVANGDYDAIIITNGTLLSIQNMTWNGKLGFQQKPSQPIIITEPDLQYAPTFAANQVPEGNQGVMGIQHYERGLMWAETFQSGHMEPEYQPRVAYRYLEWVLGRIQQI